MTLTCLAEQHVVVCGLCLLPEPIVESCRAAHCVSALLQLHGSSTTAVQSLPSTPLATVMSASGNYMAAFDAKKSRWRVTTVKPKKQIAMKVHRDDAMEDLELLDAGEHKWQKKNNKTAIVESMAEFDRNQKVLPNRESRPEFNTQTRTGNWYRGGPAPPKEPLDAKKRKIPVPITVCPKIGTSLSPTKAAQKLIDSTEDTRATKRFRSSLSQMIAHCAGLKAKLGFAYSKIAHMSWLLANNAAGEDAAADVPKCTKCTKCSFRSHASSKSKIDRELIGQGYDPMDTGRTLRRHRLAVMRALEKECGKDNKLRQYEVASAVLSMFKQKSDKKTLKQIASKDAVVKGLETTFAIISARSNGNSRYTSKDRVVRDALTTAIMMAKPDNVTINAMKAALGNVVDWESLQAGLARAAAFKREDAEIVSPEASCGAYDLEWEQFVSDCWLATTRESERKSDEKWSRQEKKWYRVRWLEQRLSDILDWMRAEGVKKFGEGFHLSSWKMKEKMPWYVRKAGRETCMCRCHMEFDHFCDALRKWKLVVAQELTTEESKQCVDAPKDPQSMRQYLQCDKEDGLYKPECSMRHRLMCKECCNKSDSLVCEVERVAKPTIAYQKWTEVPYHCKDGRVLSTHDFMSHTSSILEFELDFKDCIQKFLPHHTRAQVADKEWDHLWDNVHNFPKSIACVTDFSNSYLHKHKYEHMQQFWCEVSTSLLGCVMRIPIDNLKDSYMSATEKVKLKKLLLAEGLPPLVTITHVLVTPNPHHDTSTVQHFWKEKLYPWIWENTTGLEGGNMFVRSDNCGGQFKSARHFRFISEHSSLPHSRGMRLLWSHFESCHGKDLSDPVPRVRPL